MRKIRFTEHQIIAVLKSVEAGQTVKDVCREAAISEASYYNWKAKYGGMDAADIKKIKDLEDENRCLKQMFADLSLECRALKDVIERFNRTYRTEILDFYLVRTLNEAREITERWLNEYNSELPHESLNNLTPEKYRLMAEKMEISKSKWN